MNTFWFIIVVLALVVLQGRLYERFIFNELSIERSFDHTDAMLGDTVQLRVTVDNMKLLPITWMHMQQVFPIELQFVNEAVTEHQNRTEYIHNMVMSIFSYQRVSRRYDIKCTKRGYYEIRGVEVRSTDLFGKAAYSIEADAAAKIVVYPKFADISGSLLPASSIQGDTAVKRWIMDDPVMTAGIRDYYRSDSYRDINWKATAKRQKLMVNKHDFTSDKKIMLLLDMDDVGDIWAASNEIIPLMETAIEVGASIAEKSIREGIPTGFATNGLYGGDREDQIVEPNTGDKQVTEILNCLGRIQYYKKYDFIRLLESVCSGLSWGTELVIIVPYIKDALMSNLNLVKDTKMTLIAMEKSELTAAPPNCSVYFYIKEGEADEVV